MLVHDMECNDLLWYANDINEMKRVLSGEVIVEKGKKPVKPQDLVRLFENIIQVRRSRAARVE